MLVEMLKRQKRGEIILDKLEREQTIHKETSESSANLDSFEKTRYFPSLVSTISSTVLISSTKIRGGNPVRKKYKLIIE